MLRSIVLSIFIVASVASSNVFAQAEGCYYTLPPGPGPMFRSSPLEALFGSRSGNEVTLTGKLSYAQKNEENQVEQRKCYIDNLVTQIGQVTEQECDNNENYTSINVEKCDCSGKCEVRYEIKEDGILWDSIVDIKRGTIDING